MQPQIWHWHYGSGKYPEYFVPGGETRDETIATAKAEGLEAHGFSICEGIHMQVTFDCFEADDLIETFIGRNEDCWGEDGAEIEPTREQSRELEQAIAAAYESWAKKHKLVGRVWSFGDTRNDEYFAPTEIV